MKNLNRRNFIIKSAAAGAGMIAGAPFIGKSFSKNSPNDTINIAVIGIHGRGKAHYEALSKIPNVKIAYLCDIDQNLFNTGVSEVEKLTGYKPAIETEFRKILDNKDINAISVATPNHWHALMTIWGCQAGKDVYVEKPVSHTVEEGRKMVEAARKYNRVVQAGTQARSNVATLEAIKFIQDGGIGDIYMAKGLCFKPRASIGHVRNSEIPAGVNWDAFLGPAPYRPFNENRFLYKWHWFWDTGNGDFGNQGIHQADIARWSLAKWEHPVKITAMGNYFVWDSDQETPNIQHIEFEYADGKLLQFEVRGLGTNDEGGVRIGDLIYGSKGWMNIDNEDSGESQARMAEVTLDPSGFSSYKESQGKSFSNNDPATADSVLNHFKNFTDCMRTRKWQDLHAEIQEGHLSTSLCHLGNIATRLKRTLHFNPSAEKFVDDAEADRYLTKMYRAPYLLPETV
jgi:predicted dehydrogenase